MKNSVPEVQPILQASSGSHDLIYKFIKVWVPELKSHAFSLHMLFEKHKVHVPKTVFICFFFLW